MKTSSHRVAALYLQAMSIQDARHFMGISDEASPEEIKGAYRRLTLQYHPDRGGSLEMMQKLNEARETIESGGSVPLEGSKTPNYDVYEESRWEDFRAKHGPQPSGSYSDHDLHNVAQHIIDKNLRQIKYRAKVPWVPGDAGWPHGGQWTYNRPFGSQVKTQRLPDGVDVDKIYESLRQYGRGKIFDLKMNDKEAWVTWKLPDGKYQSLSFELVKSKPKKAPGVGMLREQIHEHLRRGGLAVVAGGTKYGYWGPRGRTEKRGYFIRESAKTLRVVKRVQGDYGRGIIDDPLAQEIYFGQVTPAILDKWIAYILKER